MEKAPVSTHSSRFKPSFVVFDFETVEVLSDGSKVASTEFYKANFRVSSCAFSYRNGADQLVSHFTQGEAETLYFLERLVDQQILLVAHNVQFEMGVIQCRFGSLAARVLWLADTMRLIQCYDNGGDEFALDAPLSLDDQLDALTIGEVKPGKSISGLSLSKAARRILKVADHKEPYYLWLRTNVEGCHAGREGAFLHHLPPKLLRDYNVADTETTLKLYEFITDYFKSINFNWRFDHGLYFNSVGLIVGAKIRGVRVAREQLSRNRDECEAGIREIESAFTLRFAEEIKSVERRKLLDAIRKRKTLRGRKGFVRRTRLDAEHFDEEIRFNVGSNKQLSALFIDCLGIQPRFLTDKGAPSFKSACLAQYGDGGELLKMRRKKMLILQQQTSLLELSAYDGYWHQDLRAPGTATGRFSGGQHGS